MRGSSESSLKGVFLKYLFSIVGSVSAVMLVYLLILGIGFNRKLLLPANTFSEIAGKYEKALESGENINIKDIPVGISYAVFDKENKLLETDFSKSELEKITAVVLEKKKENIFPGGQQKQINVIRTDQKTYVFEYYITLEFASPLLRKVFPHVEWGLMLFLIFLIILDVILISLFFARKLAMKINCMKQAADQIRDGELDFQITDTRVKELDDVMRSLDALRKYLKKSLNSQWELQQRQKEQMGALAHDIKTPLTIIRGNTDLLLETGTDEEQRSYLTHISDNVKRIQEYTEKLIEITKGKLEGCKIRDLDSTEFISDFESRIRPFLLYKNLTLKSENRISQKNIFADPQLCMRALMNLIDNAVYYSPENGVIYVSEWEENAYICFEIEDEGVGFTEQDLKNATIEFYRADQSRNMDGHVGMGLYIVRQIAELHQGNLTLARGRRGARVTLRISRNGNQNDPK